MKPHKTFAGISLLLVLLHMSFSIRAQQVIHMDNPSFEATPRRGGMIPQPIPGWVDCGMIFFPSESAPDIHPVPGGAWEVTQSPKDGKSFLGLVVRYNQTWEFVSQNLSTPLESGKCYDLKMYLSTSPQFESATFRNRKTRESFVKSVVLEIWGGDSHCDKRLLLARSHPVNHTEWREYTFTLSPTQEIKSMVLAAFFNQEEEDEAYNGHVLVDHLSAIVEKACE